MCFNTLNWATAGAPICFKALNVFDFSFSFLEWEGGPCLISLGTLDAIFFALPIDGLGFPIAIAKSKENLTCLGLEQK